MLMKLSMTVTCLAWWSTIATAQEPFGFTTASVNTIQANTPTAVTVTSEIQPGAVLPTSVLLQRLNENGSVTVVGRLHDDGLDGDSGAVDGVYSLRFIVNQSAASVLTYRMSAALNGVPRRVLSNPFEIVVQSNQRPEEMLSQLAAELRQADATKALSHFSPSPANQFVFSLLDQTGREKLAQAFEHLVLTSSSSNARFYDMPWTNDDGSTETTRVILEQGRLGKWMIVSW